MALHNNLKLFHLLLLLFSPLFLPTHLAQPKVSPSPAPDSSPSLGPAPGPTQGLSPSTSPTSGRWSPEDYVDDDIDTLQFSISLPPSSSEAPFAPPPADAPSDFDSSIDFDLDSDLSPANAPSDSDSSIDFDLDSDLSPTNAPSDSDSSIDFDLDSDLSPANAPSSNSNPQLKKICDSTDHPSLCISTVAPYLDGETDVPSVLDISIQAGAQFSKYAQVMAQKLAGNPGNPPEHGSVLNDCKGSFEEASDNYGRAGAALTEQDRGTVSTMLSAVITYAGDCQDKISEDSELYDITDRLINMTSNCLAINSLMNSGS